MTSVLVLLTKIYRNQLKRSCLRNKELFLKFLLHLQNLHQFLNLLKKDDRQSVCISEITDCQMRG